MAILCSELDRYGGRVVDDSSLPADATAFAADLEESIDEWRNDVVRVVWVNLPLRRAELVPIATHYVGAGGVVINNDRELLVVQERHHTRKHYKLPGGMLGPGEHIADAVRREIKEETNIDTRFLSLVCFRHWHGYRFDRSDIYFTCRLEPISFDIVPDPSEIAECFWMPVDDYFNHPDVHAFNRRIVRAALESNGLVQEQIDGDGTSETHEFMMPSS